MKKLESLTLNKFKMYELHTKNHNQVLGGRIGQTTTNGKTTNDNYDDATMNRDGTYNKHDVTPLAS